MARVIGISQSATGNDLSSPLPLVRNQVGFGGDGEEAAGGKEIALLSCFARWLCGCNLLLSAMQLLLLL